MKNRAIFLYDHVHRFLWLIALLVFFKLEGITPQAVLTSAQIISVLWLGIAFGAQTILQGVVSAFFLRREKLFVIGTVLTVATPDGTFTGAVTRLSGRVTTLRDSTGRVAIIPNALLFSTVFVLEKP